MRGLERKLPTCQNRARSCLNSAKTTSRRIKPTSCTQATIKSPRNSDSWNSDARGQKPAPMDQVVSPNTRQNSNTHRSPPTPLNSAVVAFNRFPDLPIPPGGEINLEKTLVFGSNEAWFGRLTVESSLNSNELFNFFKQEVPGFGWQEITSIRSALSVLTYTRNKRVATIQIAGGFLSGASASITVSPQESKGAPQGDQGRAPQYAPQNLPRQRMTAPVSPVQQEPTMPPFPAPVLRGR